MATRFWITNPVLICGGRQMSKLVVVKAHAIEANIQTQEKWKKKKKNHYILLLLHKSITSNAGSHELMGFALPKLWGNCIQSLFSLYQLLLLCGLDQFY